MFLCGTIALILLMKRIKAGGGCAHMGSIARCACCSKKKEEEKNPINSDSLNNERSHQHLVVPPRPEIPGTLEDIRKQYDVVNPILPAYAPTYATLKEKDNNDGEVEVTRF